MRLYGYTDDKDVVDVDLPIAEIVRHNIDPWRLDLFDPDPAVYRAGEIIINFKKLADVAFAYKTAGQSYLILNDGKERTCLACDGFNTRVSGEAWAFLRHGDLAPDADTGPRFSGGDYNFRQLKAESTMLGFTASDRSYEEHLLEYLPSLLNNTRVPIRPFAPYPASSVSMKGDSVVFTQHPPSLELNAFIQFAGEMFEERTASFVTPPLVQWLLEQFGEFEPIVIGTALWDALAGKEITEVGFLHKRGTGQEVWQKVQKLDGVSTRREALDWRLTCGRQEFERDGCLFTAGNQPLSDLHTPATWLRDSAYRFSPDGLYCERVNELCGTRIGFFDVSKGQARPVSRHAVSATFDSTVAWSLSHFVDEDERHRRLQLDAASSHFKRANLKIGRPLVIRNGVIIPD